MKDDVGCRMNSMKTFSRPGWVSCSKAVVLFLLLLSLATALACSGGLPKDIPTNEEAVKKALKDKSIEKLKEVAEGVPAVQKAADLVMQAQLEGCAKMMRAGVQAVTQAFSLDQKDVQLDPEMLTTMKDLFGDQLSGLKSAPTLYPTSKPFWKSTIYPIPVRSISPSPPSPWVSISSFSTVLAAWPKLSIRQRS